MDYSLNFRDKVAVVTGAASGIGKATAIAFGSLGANVVLVDVNEKNGLEVSKTITNLGVKSLFIKTDTSNEEETERMASIIKKEFGTPHILVNSAGIEFNDRGNLVDMPYDLLKKILDVNLYGYIHCVRALAPLMKEGGSIVNISSIQGLAVHSPGTSYQVSKSGILGLTRALAIELACSNINVNTVAPGAIATEGMGAVRGGESSILDPYRRRIPLKRRGRAEEIAGPILFFCSSLASYITGSVLVVDGGYLINLTPDFGEVIKPVVGDPDL
ncbi:MAG: SDR family oxidoreductase [Candidatus Liptonbacteria bacterium]|nr:SDR family oxidoreductase [Candidatus Liptonbacteria bacterium]